MTVELQLLAWSALLALVMALAGGIIRAKGWAPAGVMLMLGNHDDMPEEVGMAGRAERAARNMGFNLILFASLVLTAAAAKVSTPETVLGAQLFFWSRLAYFPVYLAGITYLRTGLWVASIVGMALIFFALV